LSGLHSTIPPAPEEPHRFIPFKLFVGSFVPNALMKYPHLSPSAKLLWARLAQYAGENGHCYPSQMTLAEELGITDRHVRTLIKELEAGGFIEAERTPKDKLMGRNARYFFLWHPIFEEEKVAPESVPEALFQYSPESEEEFQSDRKDCSSPNRKDCSGPTKENHIKENHNKQEEEVFAFWKQTFQFNNQTKFTDTRRMKVGARLKEGFSVADLKRAVIGCKLSPWHQGENPSGAVYDDLELICRNDANVRRFIATAEKMQAGTMDGRVEEIRYILKAAGEGAAVALAKQYGIEWGIITEGRLM
jgi:hypothetical protein